MSQATHKASPWDEWCRSPYSHTSSLTSRPHLLQSGEELLPTKWNSFSGGPGIPYAAWSWLTCTFTGGRRCAFRSPQTEARIKLRSDTPQSTFQWSHLYLKAMARSLITTFSVKMSIKPCNTCPSTLQTSALTGHRLPNKQVGAATLTSQNQGLA